MISKRIGKPRRSARKWGFVSALLWTLHKDVRETPHRSSHREQIDEEGEVVPHPTLAGFHIGTGTLEGVVREATKLSVD